jgi:hypothetical protein
VRAPAPQDIALAGSRYAQRAPTRSTANVNPPRGGRRIGFGIGKPGFPIPIRRRHWAIGAHRDVVGALLGYVLRFDGPEGKHFRPLTMWRPAVGTKPKW